MRIAFVISRLGRGGAERQLVALVNAIDRARFAPTVICLKDAGSLAADLDADVPIVGLGYSGNDPRVVSRLAALLRAEHIELVHCTNFNATAWGRLAARRVGIPAVTAEHSTNRSSRREALLVKLFNRLLDRGTCAVVACARAQTQVLVAEGNAEDHIRVIYNGVPARIADAAPERSGVRAALGIAEGEVVLTVVANLSPQKNHELLLRAVKRLVEDGRAVQVLLVGAGPMRAALEAQAERDGLTRAVQFLGSRSDVPALLAASDVVALTSHYEGLPMCLLEAMSASLPVVATRVGGIGEMVLDGETGLLVSPGDSAGLAAALRSLVDDADLRRQLGGAGRRRMLEHFTVECMTRQYEVLIESILVRPCE